MAPVLTNLVGIDYGKPGGDMTGITARCPKCQRIYSMSFESGNIVLMPVELQCECGVVTDLRAAAEPSGNRCFACGHPVAPLTTEEKRRLKNALDAL
jgi:uncharacterized protein with PIN domain